MKFPKAGLSLIFCLFLPACFDFDSMNSEKKSIKNDSILLIKIDGVITSELSERFMKYIRNYVAQDRIKGVLVRINSPGGTVGACQEINTTIKEVREFYKKPVFVSGGDMVASGAVYSIMTADKIFTPKGSLFGSIGVLMEFQNIRELMSWAKMDFYHLKAGEFKDSGSPYREMTLRERELFENLLESALDQFKQAIIKGRSLEPKLVESFADGRIFTGEDAFGFGLVDVLGTFNQAARAIGKETGLGSNPKLFDPGKKSSFEKVFDNFPGNSFSFEKLFSRWIFAEKLSGQPLYILPSYISPQ